MKSLSPDNAGIVIRKLCRAYVDTVGYAKDLCRNGHCLISAESRRPDYVEILLLSDSPIYGVQTGEPRLIEPAEILSIETA